MKRRQVLGGAAGLAMGTGLWSVFGVAPAWGVAAPTVLADHLLRACPKRLSAVAVGRAYLQELGGAPPTDRVVDRLIDHLDVPRSRLEAMTSEDLRARLRTRTSEDFGAGRTVRVRGWVLGETEAWLYGLAALRAG